MNDTEPPPTFEPPYSEVEPWLRAVHSLVAVLLMAAGLVGNCLVLWVVARNKELQYRSILASMGAVAVNILFCLFTGPQVLAGSITGEWPFTHAGCVAVGFVANGIFYVRWTNTLLIAVDRFLYIITPFWYQRNSKPVLVTLTTFVWTVPFVSNAPSAVYRTYSFRSTLTICAVNCEQNDGCYTTYILLFAMYMIVGVLLPAAIYTFLYCYGKKKRREMNREMGTHTQDDTHSVPVTNGRLPNYLSARRPSTDLVSIDEEDEGEAIPMQELPHPPATSSDLDTIREHEVVVKIVRLQDGRRHQQADAISLESDPGPQLRDTPQQENDHTPSKGAEPADSIHQKRKLGHRRGSSESGTGSTSSYHRRTSIVVLSRAALSAFVPNRQHMGRERRAMVTFAIIFTNLVFTQILLFILSAVRRQEFYKYIPIWVHMIAMNLFLLAPVIEPLIIIKNQDFKRVLLRIFRRRHSFSTSHSVPTK